MRSRQYVTAKQPASVAQRKQAAWSRASMPRLLNDRIAEDDLGTLRRARPSAMRFRPISQDRINALLRYSFVLDVGTDGQTDAPGGRTRAPAGHRGGVRCDRLAASCAANLRCADGRQRLLKGEGDWFRHRPADAGCRVSASICRSCRGRRGAKPLIASAFCSKTRWSFWPSTAGSMIDLAKNSSEGLLLGIYQHFDPRRFRYAFFLGSVQSWRRLQLLRFSTMIYDGSPTSRMASSSISCSLSSKDTICAYFI